MAASLADWQRRFFSALREPSAVPESLGLAPGHRTSAETGLRIYRNAYQARLVEALESDHPQLGTYLGDELWHALCAGYVAAHPSQVRSLRHFGESLPDHLARAPAFAALPQCAELARWERRLLDTFDAPDGPRADFSELLSLGDSAWPTLRLRFHPSVQPFAAGYNSVEIWQALKDGTAPPAAVARRSHWLLWRDPTLVTRYRSLDGEEADAVAHFLAGGDFAGLCERLLATRAAPDVPATALAFLRQWSADGWIGRWVADDLAPAVAEK